MKLLKNITKLHIFMAAVLVSAFLLTHVVLRVAADTNTGSSGSGTSEITVAGLDYVDQQDRELNAKITDLTAKIADLSAKNEALKTDNTALQQSVAALTARLDDLSGKLAKLEEKPAQEGGAGFTLLQLKAGKSLVGKGSAEVILRTGKATAVSTKDGGLIDLYTGKDLTTGAPIVKNHQVLIPKSDGRGIKAGADSWILVRGTYTVK